MNLATVMQQLADRLNLIDGLQVFGFPADSISPPAAIVDYPEGGEFDSTYQRGTDEMTIPVYLMVGRASDRAARDSLGPFCDGSGPRSVKQVLEQGQYSSFDTCQVGFPQFDVFTINAVDVWAAKFSVQIYGTGAA